MPEDTRRDNVTREGSSGAAVDAIRISAGEFAQNPAKYYGKKVTCGGSPDPTCS